MSCRNAVSALVAGAFTVCAAFAQTNTTTTATFTRSEDLPVMGVAITDTLQVNLVNTAAASSSGTAASCTGSVSFYNAAGSILGTATNFTLGSGQISSVKLPYASAGGSGSRALVRTVVTSQGTAPPTAPCALGVTLETYDTATGVTHAFAAGGGAGPQGGGGPQQGGPGGR